jgi:hypothetical protein
VPPAEIAASVREGLGPRGAEALLCAGDSGRIIDSFAQPSMDDLYKSFCICSKDRKYFSGASGIKISDKEQPTP